ncbi:MAG: RDD family protein [Burkholderiaceae bacterium]
MSAGAGVAAAAKPPPALTRRLACMVYEGVILFGVVMAAGLLYASLTQQRHALQGTLGLQAFVFVVLGIYFVGFWSRSGQTLPMKTWHLRVVRGDGSPVPPWQALLRYLLAWLWFVPALATAHHAGVRSGLGLTAVVAAGMAAYVLLARARPDRQFLHDVACGTRIIDVRPAPPLPAQSAR